MSIFGKKNKNGDRSVNLSFVDGVDAYSRGSAIALSIDNTNECITITSRLIKGKPPVHLKLEQITGVDVISEKEIIEKSRSTVGRAVAGGVLFGSLGAIVGGMSGVGNSHKSETHYFMVISYRSGDKEIKGLIFEIVGSSLHWSSFVDELRSKIKIEEITEIYL